VNQCTIAVRRARLVEKNIDGASGATTSLNFTLSSQKKHWKAGHKKECAALKAKAEEEEEKAAAEAAAAEEAAAASAAAAGPSTSAPKRVNNKKKKKGSKK
jgi:hypothetical protein